MPIPRRSWKQRLLAAGIILIILALGALVAVYLMKTGPQAQKKPPSKMKVLARAMAVAPTAVNVTIDALGKVIPAREVQLQARVSGTVVELHPGLIPGGLIGKDEVVLRLDDVDYSLTLQQKLNALAQARADLRIEEGSQFVALQEWQLINGEIENIDTSSQDLALRKPQLAKVQAAVNAAETEVERARVDLDRTVIRAPFNAIVFGKNIDMGSQVSTQSILATLTGIDEFWADISIPADKLSWIVFPGRKEAPSKVEVRDSQGNLYSGQLLQLMPDIDREGLMARLLIGVQDPMGIKSGKKPVLLGSFVRVRIEGKRIENVFQVPRSALKENDRVLLVTDAATLHIQPVTVKWRDADFVFVDSGLKQGDRIIVSNVAAPIEGMELELTENGGGGVRAAQGKADGRK